jgi:ribosome-associated protein
VKVARRGGRTDAAGQETSGLERQQVKLARGAAQDIDDDAAGTERVKSARRSAVGSAVGKPKKLPADVARAVSAALDKKAQDVVVLDLRNTPAFTDFFVLCSGLSQRQVKAIADGVEETLRAIKVRPAHIEGYDRADWVLMDFFTFIVHVFTPQTRAFYSLERLWGDAERIDVSDEPPQS